MFFTLSICRCRNNSHHYISIVFITNSITDPLFPFLSIVHDPCFKRRSRMVESYLYPNHFEFSQTSRFPYSNVFSLTAFHVSAIFASNSFSAPNIAYEVYSKSVCSMPLDNYHLLQPFVLILQTLESLDELHWFPIRIHCHCHVAILALWPIFIYNRDQCETFSPWMQWVPTSGNGKSIFI